MNRLAWAVAVAVGTWRAGFAEGETDLEKARRLIEEAQHLYVQQSYDEAGECYEEALPLFERAYGAGTPEALRISVQIRRAKIGIHVKRGQFDEAIPVIAEFFEDVARLGGAGKQEALVRQSVGNAADELAVRGETDGMKRMLEAWKAGADRAEKDLRKRSEADAAAFAARRVEEDAFLGKQQVVRLLLEGDRDKALAEYLRIAAFWEKRGNAQMTAWLPHNLFFSMTQVARPADAAFFLVETLDRLRANCLDGPVAHMIINTRDYLARLREQGKKDEAKSFLAEAIALGRKKGAYLPGFDEGALRGWLAEFLADAPKDAAANGDAMSDFGKAEGDTGIECAGALIAGEALLATDPAKALERAERALAAAEAGGHTSLLGRAQLLKGRALTALKKHDDADASLLAALKTFESIDDTRNRTTVRAAAFRNAEAAGREGMTEKYGSLKIRLNGGAAGISAGDMAPADMIRRIEESTAEQDVLEVRRAGDVFHFTNLLDGTDTIVDPEGLLRNLNVSGMLLQVYGEEVALLNRTDKRGAAATPAQAVVGGQAGGTEDSLVYTGPEFEPFALRMALGDEDVVRITSGLRLYRVRK